MKVYRESKETPEAKLSRRFHLAALLTEGWTKRVTCRHCDSILEIDRDDIEVGTYMTMGDYFFRVQCPVCRRFHSFGAWILPWLGGVGLPKKIKQYAILKRQTRKYILSE